ncbi:MAG: tripartite tricarboxylate transporter substrate binding protein [Gammaproteobacteria bacterium]|nr:tripartite tricarboxylate transporter substrate binding protein [Gammaproteobacteria bacterium]MBU1443786.1 tripartite tricarboxylate transporter substrate binding protein [Gammaproteobacteria bacterium]MBU2284798.1 tripartite tricarboxylate transporter substrate binding protein [Gammaproteobacteria bacterium]MBU2410156.1 tripartite tricarboxylate transporter substrate binding protein [Gammaproteobacteria bacterium]
MTTVPTLSSTPIPRTGRRALLAAGLCCAAAFGLLPAGAAHAQGWPEAGKPIRIVVGFPPGGGADVLARAVSVPLGNELGGNVIVENRAGAGGLLATEYVAKQPSDGYTVYLATPGSFTIWPSLRKLNYDPAKDFAPVSLMVTMPNLLVTGMSTPYKNVAGLLAAAKAPNAQIDYASGGIGTIGQIAAEQLNILAGIRLTHVPYKGTAPLLTDVIGGVVPVTFSDPSAMSLVEGGKLRLLAQTSAKRSRLFPDTPTMAESGVPGFDLSNWCGMVAPASTPSAIVDKLNGALAKVMARPEVRKQLAGAGMDATSSTPAQFGDHMATERAKWAALIVKANIRAE